MKASYIGGYLLAILATLISIVFLDRTIAVFAYEHQLRGVFFEAMTWPSDLLQLFAGILLLACLKREWRDRFGRMTSTLLISLAIAWSVRLFSKFAFGRTWPDTWVNDNPSWLQNGVEGFFPFTGGAAYSAFPSGHALVTFALVTVFWFAVPRFRWFWAFSGMCVIVGMLGQYYHYLGDLLAGATLGCMCGHLAIAIQPKLSGAFLARERPSS